MEEYYSVLPLLGISMILIRLAKKYGSGVGAGAQPVHTFQGSLNDNHMNDNFSSG